MMLTILEAINLSSEYLEKKGIEESKRNAELLLCRILGCDKLYLYLNFERPLTAEEISGLRELVRRRGSREPVQYIIGNVEFYGLEFKVNGSVLIPRPETEILVEAVINDSKEKKCRILDIGTGSGNIAVALAVNMPYSEITAIDISAEALLLASENAAANKCLDRINFIEADIFTECSELIKKFDIIVANPPYISEMEFSILQPELRIYEPKSALSDNSDGLSFYRRIAVIADKLFEGKGKVYFELGAGQAEEVYRILSLNGFLNINMVKDYQHIQRIISGEKN